jgi:hypothetical protein
MRLIVLAALLWLSASMAQSQSEPAERTVERIFESLRENEQPKFSYRELAAKSDLIAIATMVEKRQVAMDVVGSTDFDRESVQRVTITLKVLSVLKGEAKEEIELISTEWVPTTVVLGLRTNFALLRSHLLLPNLSVVEIDGVITDWKIMDSGEKISIVPEYLLYLKRSGRENTYTPVTGQRWGGASVRLLND